MKMCTNYSLITVIIMCHIYYPLSYRVPVWERGRIRVIHHVMRPGLCARYHPWTLETFLLLQSVCGVPNSQHFRLITRHRVVIRCAIQLVFVHVVSRWDRPVFGWEHVIIAHSGSGCVSGLPAAKTTYNIKITHQIMYTAFEMWRHTRRNQISSFGETDEST